MPEPLSYLSLSHVLGMDLSCSREPSPLPFKAERSLTSHDSIRNCARPFLTVLILSMVR